MEFKQLEVKPEKGLKTFIRSPHFKKTTIYIILGAVAGFLFFYITEGRNHEQMAAKEIINSALIGAFFGFFITNSPCARNKC